MSTLDEMREIGKAVQIDNSKRINEHMRQFDTGATRSSDHNKIDPEGFFSPDTIVAYCEYMHKHRVQADGKVRDSDNWQKGMPLSAYMKSLWRHMLHVWLLHRGLPAYDENGKSVTMKDSLCAILFNTFGYLNMHLRDERSWEEAP